MSGIGKNTYRIDQNLILGKEIGNFGKSIEDKKKAVEIAKIMPGSELVYQNKDKNWTVSEIKEEGIIYGNDNLYECQKSDIKLDNSKLKEKGISNPVISFVDEESDELVKAKLAYDPQTPKIVLAELAKDNNPLIRAIVALNSSTSPVILTNLSKDNSELIIPGHQNPVQEAVASNPKTPKNSLRELAKHDSPSVRAQVGQNENTPLNVIKNLSYDLEKIVRANVALNPKIDIETLKELLNDTDKKVKTNAASNSSIPDDLLKELSNSKNIDIKLGVYFNSKCPQEISKKLRPELEKAVKENKVELLAPALDEKGEPILENNNEIIIKVDLDNKPILDKNGNYQIR